MTQQRTTDLARQCRVSKNHPFLTQPTIYDGYRATLTNTVTGASVDGTLLEQDGSLRFHSEANGDVEYHQLINYIHSGRVQLLISPLDACEADIRLRGGISIRNRIRVAYDRANRPVPDTPFWRLIASDTGSDLDFVPV